jgi:hypothetical protein
MRRKLPYVALALCAALAVAGCGEDNGGNDNDGGTDPTPVRTSTPVGPTATALVPTATSVSPVETPTGGPVPTATPTGGDGACGGAALQITVTSLAGSDLDTGWTGIAHNSVAIEGASVTTNLDCTGDDCTVDGSALAGTTFGSPLPLSSGGVATCVTNTFREGVTGTYNCQTGCGESTVRLTSAVFLSQDITRPCPRCENDPTPNDGQKGGTCDDQSATSGAACDVGGTSALFGPTSNDCLPRGTAIANLPIDLAPLTTGTVTRTADVDCASFGFPPGSCFCPDQIRPNPCLSGSCPESGECQATAQPEGICSGQTFRTCFPENGNGDCEDTFPGAGSCQERLRPCFGTTISRTGTCGGSANPATGTLVGIFCIPRTSAPAVDTTAGLPGPGALSLPSGSLRTVR